MKAYNITVEGKTYYVEVEEIGAAEAVATSPAPAKPVARPKPKAAPVAGGSGAVTAPMPGSVVALKVSVGQSVKRGDLLLVLEAMKMENDIKSPVDGVVVSLPVSAGAAVSTGDLLAEVEAEG